MGLTNALQEISDLVFKNENHGNPEPHLEEIAKKSDVKQEDLTLFYNNFAELKLIMDRKGVPNTRNMDYTKPEIEIIMDYIEQKEPEVGKEQAFKNLSTILSKTKSGVQYKYYQTQNALKNPEKAVGKRGRKPKANPNNLKVVDEAKKTKAKKEETKTEKKEAKKQTTSQKTKSQTKEARKTKETSNKEATTTTPYIPQQRGDETLEEYMNRANKALGDGKRNVNIPKQTQDITETKEKEETVQPAQQEVSKKTESKVESMGLISMLSGMINNFNVLDQNSALLQDENINTTDVVKGLYVLSSIAAENVDGASKKSELEKKLELAELDVQTAYKEVERVRQDNRDVVEEYRKLASLVQELHNMDDTKKIVNMENYFEKMNQLIESTGFGPTPTGGRYKLDASGMLVNS